MPNSLTTQGHPLCWPAASLRCSIYLTSGQNSLRSQICLEQIWTLAVRCPDKPVLLVSIKGGGGNNCTGWIECNEVQQKAVILAQAGI